MIAAVIPTRGRGCLTRCVEAIMPQVDHVFLVVNGTREEPVEWPRLAHMIYDPAPEPNISRWWNLGIDRARSYGATHVAVLNDDAIVADDWVQRVKTAMDREGVSLGGSPRSGRPELVAGYAFMLAGDLRADEQFVWWGGEADLMRQTGYTVARDARVEHLYPNGSTTGELATIAGQDKQRFIEKWGDLRCW